MSCDDLVYYQIFKWWSMTSALWLALYNMKTSASRRMNILCRKFKIRSRFAFFKWTLPTSLCVRVEMNFCPGSKNFIIGKTPRKPEDMTELSTNCHFYKVSLIKTRLMFHKYHLLNQLQVFMRYKKLPIRALINKK